MKAERFLILLVMFYLLSGSNAEASSWVLVSENILNDAFYIDKESITGKDSMVRYWRRVKFAPNEKYKEILSYQEIDCPGRRIRSLHTINYYENGQHDNHISETWMHIEPESMNEQFYDSLCPKK